MTKMRTKAEVFEIEAENADDAVAEALEKFAEMHPEIPFESLQAVDIEEILEN